jgi:hypothetical protein
MLRELGFIYCKRTFAHKRMVEVEAEVQCKRMDPLPTLVLKRVAANEYGSDVESAEEEEQQDATPAPPGRAMLQGSSAQPEREYTSILNAFMVATILTR